MTLTVNEFMRRFMLHVLRKRFHRIRPYGLHANGSRTDNVERARQLLQVSARAKVNADDEVAAKSDDPQMLNLPRPECGGRLIIIETFVPDIESKICPAPEPIDSS